MFAKILFMKLLQTVKIIYKHDFISRLAEPSFPGEKKTRIQMNKWMNYYIGVSQTDSIEEL